MTAVNDLSDRQWIAAHVLSVWEHADDRETGAALMRVRDRLAVKVAREVAARPFTPVEDDEFPFDGADRFRAADLLVEDVVNLMGPAVDSLGAIREFLHAVVAGAR